MYSRFEKTIPVWQGEDPWLFIQRHRPAPMPDTHWHSHIEINYLIDTAITYQSGGCQINVAPRKIAVFWAAIPHQVTVVESTGEIICAYVPLQEFMRWNLPIRFSHEVMHGGFLLGIAEDATDAPTFERWWQDWQSEDPSFRRLALDEIQLRLRRLALTGWRLGNSAQAPVRMITGLGTPARTITHVEAMANFIAEHYIEPIGVDDVAGHIGLHPNYAMALFKRVVGLPVSAYITRHRLSHAQAMLLNTDKTILNIVMDCGFGSQSRFYETFRRRLGLTPRQYREQWRRR